MPKKNKMINDALLDKVVFNQEGLVVVVVQSVKDNRLLMQAYMNRESLLETLSSGRMVFWSRSRQELWVKGATSGNYQWWEKIMLDCDGDSLLALVKEDGPACHLGNDSCFERTLAEYQ